VIDVEDTDQKSTIVKIPRVQTKKGIFDLIFETQLQMYLSNSLGKYTFKVKEEIFSIKDTRLMNYIVIEERENYQTLQEFNSLIRANKDIENKNEKVIYLLYQAIEMAKKLTTEA